MNAKLFSEAMSEVDRKYYEEAENYRYKKPVWVKWGAIAACLAAFLFAVSSVLPHALPLQGTAPPDDPKGAIVDDPRDTADDATPTASEIHISMDKLSFNEVEAWTDAARLWPDPEQYDRIEWDRDALMGYYGKDLTPPYIPDGLTPASGNGTARVFADKSGKMAEDTVWLGFYHDYYEDGSPKLTDTAAAVKGFSVTASKIGLLRDCLYILPENEVKTSDIGGTAVAFGYRSMPYGPYDPDTHEPSGCYELYTAEFEQDGIEYEIIAEQLTAEEVVKVAASIIYGKEVVVDGET